MKMELGEVTVTVECELLGNCSYFNTYSKQTKAKEAWIRLYCKDKNKSEKCERKKNAQSNRRTAP